MTSLRRSTRARRPVETIYDSASKKEAEADGNKRKRSKSREPSVSEDDDHDADNETIVSRSEDEDMMNNDSDDNDESEAEEEDFIHRGRKRKSPATNKSRQTTAAAAKTKKKRSASTTAAQGGKARKHSRSQVQTALTAMAKKIACEGETAENSLALALMLSFKASSGGTNSGKKNNNNSRETIYTAQLQKIAQKVIEEHEANANRAQVALLNLIFRSIGGSFQSFLDANEVDLEEVSDDDLGELIDVIVADMEGTDIVHTLLPITPAKAPSIAAQEYRKIFQEFWYQLGAVALSGAVDSSPSKKDDSDEDDDSETEGEDSSVKKKKKSSARFQVELVRDILSRLVEIMQAGLADIRTAVCTAVYSMSLSVLEKTAELKQSLETAERQLHVAKRSKSSRKAEALENQIGSWKRTLADLESIAIETVFGSVFLRRYRDVNPQIRASSTKALSQFTLIRPDLFLSSTYLKYFGWLLSDKDAVVREAAISALLAPFRAVSDRKGKSHSGMTINLEGMQSVVGKFLGRLADCVIDVDMKVQESAMQLLLVLLRHDFFDEVENDRIWEQINMRALNPDTTPTVRRDALYFVMEQLEVFDSTSSSVGDAVERINALVDWIAHALSDSDIPQEAIRYGRTDLVICSLRCMPEHKALVCNWTAMLRVLQRDDTKRSGRKSFKKGDQRIDAVKQRVVLRMLTAAAKMEVVDAGKGTLAAVADPDVIDGRNAEHSSLQSSKKQKKNGSSHEELTLALLGALPDLLTSFKSETLVLQSLTSLPQYFLPSVLNLSSRKRDFQSLMTNLSRIFLESTDQTVLQNCCMAIVSFAKGEHARSNEALLRLKELAGSLRDRLLELLNEKSKQTEDGSDDDEHETLDGDLERSISLCLRRLVILSKRWSLAELLSEAADDTIDDEELGNICSAVTKYIGNELKARQSKYHEETEGDACIEIAKIWETADEEIHSIVAESVSEGLEFLLSVTGWRLKEEIGRIEESDWKKDYSDEQIKNHLVIQVRDWISRLIILCYEQFISQNASDIVSEKHLEFAEAVQDHAVRVSGDLRAMFPRDWSKVASPFLSACALIDDGVLIGAGVRFVRTQERKIREAEEGSDEKQQAIIALLLPLARGLCPNWETGNRREAGAALAHIAGSGKEAHDVAQSISRVLKKIEPVRLLEAHMACLRQDFEAWAESEPEELGDRPTDAEMARYDAEEAAHSERFEFIQHQASRLAASLGVGKLHDERLARALLGFVREGVRFAFSTNEPGSEEELPLGCRLPFLRILNKYLNWIRRDDGFKEVLKKELNEKETALRNHPEFGEILEDDLKALSEFRESGDLGDFVKETETVSVSQLSTIGGTTPGSRSRLSLGTTIASGSVHGLSTQGSLDDGSLESIREDPAENDAESTPSPQKRQKTTPAKSEASAGDSSEDDVSALMST